jgi:uncharacterized membrane protein
MESIRTIAEFGALFCTSLFAGSALYITLVEHPARMECGTTLAATEFGPSYRRATLLQVPLAIVGFLSSLIAWFAGAPLLWLIAGVLLILVIPFTLLAIFPTNKKLLDPALDHSSSNTRELLMRWGRLHAVRTVLSLIALLIFLLL